MSGKRLRKRFRRLTKDWQYGELSGQQHGDGLQTTQRSMADLEDKADVVRKQNREVERDERAERRQTNTSHRMA
jgi:hypothetical protein